MTKNETIDDIVASLNEIIRLSSQYRFMTIDAKEQAIMLIKLHADKSKLLLYRVRDKEL